MKSGGGADAFFAAERPWSAEMHALRAQIREHPLSETMKWGWPCYALDGRNVVLIHAFKQYCALLLFKGALLDDPEGALVRQTENVQIPRQLRFTSTAEIKGRSKSIRALIAQAIALEQSGEKSPKPKRPEQPRPPEFEEALAQNPALQTAFAALTPGRQRAYLLHFSAAKQAKTRASRIETCAPHILAGKGLDD